MNNINQNCRQVLEIAKQYSKEYSNAFCEPPHLLKALMHRDFSLIRTLDTMGKDIFFIEEWAEIRIEELEKSTKKNDEALTSERIITTLDEAECISKANDKEEIDLISIFQAVITPGVAFSHDQLKSFSIAPNELTTKTNKPVNTKSTYTTTKNNHVKKNSMIERFCRNKIDEAKNSTEHRVVARDNELRNIIEIIGRYTKPNVLLVGEPGVGKTTLLKGLANNVAEGRVPMNLKNLKIYELNVVDLLAGASYKGEVEDRLNKILIELKALKNCILMIDEVHMLIDRKHGYENLINQLKPELVKNDIIFIGATTIEEYRKHIETDDAFNRRFELIRIEEPDDESALRMVSEAVEKLKEYHQLTIDKSCIQEAIRLAKRYTRERKLPDTVVDLIDRTMAVVKSAKQTTIEDITLIEQEFEELVENKKDSSYNEIQWFYNDLKGKISPILLNQIEFKTEETTDEKDLINHINEGINQLKTIVEQPKNNITKIDIASVMANKTGIPVGKIGSEELQRLQKIESHLQQRVVGQNHAIDIIAESIRESRSGLASANQPIGSFFFLGPTGTGKTELAKSLAEFLFFDENSLIRFDMSEFKEEHSAALLYGAPPGYVGYENGGLLVNKIREKPYSIVLFDEIEKAHPSVFDLFLQILDEGKLHDRLGKEGDFTNAIILFTSNIGSEFIIDSFGKNEIPTSSALLEIMSSYFRPEFLARLTEIVPFSPIKEEVVRKIFDIQLNKLVQTLEQKGIQLSLSQEAKNSLANKGFSPKYGARPIKAVIRNELTRPIAKMIINEKINKKNPLHVNLLTNGDIKWRND